MSKRVQPRGRQIQTGLIFLTVAVSVTGYIVSATGPAPAVAVPELAARKWLGDARR